MSRLYIDFEIIGRVPIKTGAMRFCSHPETVLLGAGYAFDDEPVRWIEPGDPDAWLPLIEHVAADGHVCAHNAEFDRAAWNAALIRTRPRRSRWSFWLPEQTSCTAARCAAFGLKRSLGDVGPQLQLGAKGDDTALENMMRRLEETGDAFGQPDLLDQRPGDVDLEGVAKYCIQDVELLRRIDKRVPQLHADETRRWIDDAKIGERGIRIDRKLLDRMTSEEARERPIREANAQIARATSGAVERTTAVPALKRWLADRNIIEPGAKLDQTAVENLLLEELDDDVRAALEARRAGSAVSLKKLDLLDQSICSDGRYRNGLMFYGAVHGRWTSTGVQLHNIPRPAKGAVDLADAIVAGEAEPPADPKGLLRSLFIASPGRTLVVADYAGIEARAGAWLAGEASIKAAFKEGRDPYIEAAERMGTDDRNLGKLVVLSAMYGAGGRSLRRTAFNWFGIRMSLDEAESHKTAFRNAFQAYPRTWGELESSFIDAVNGEPNDWYRPVDGGVAVELPSGRDIVYQNPRLIERRHNGNATVDIEYDPPIKEKPELYGARMFNHVTCGAARDILADAISRLDDAGFDVVLSVHDEVIVECEPGDGPEIVKIMEAAPDWCPTWIPRVDMVECARWAKP